MNYDQIQRAALGRNANFGDCYDAYNDAFTNLSAFKAPQLVQMLDVSTEFKSKWKPFSTLNETLCALSKPLEIPADQVFGLLFERHEGGLKGYEYLADWHSSTDGIVKGVFVLIHYASEEKINVFENDRIDKALIKDTLGSDLRQGTHVVNGVISGGQIIVSFDCPIASKWYRKPASLLMEKLLRYFDTLWSDTTSLRKQIGQHHQLKYFRVNVQGDVNVNASTTINNIEKLINYFPTLIKDLSKIRKPLIYTMYPVLKISSLPLCMLDPRREFFPLFKYQIREVEIYFFKLIQSLSKFSAFIEIAKRDEPDHPKLEQMILNKEKARRLLNEQRRKVTEAIIMHREQCSFFSLMRWENITRRCTHEYFLSVTNEMLEDPKSEKEDFFKPSKGNVSESGKSSASKTGKRNVPKSNFEASTQIGSKSRDKNGSESETRKGSKSRDGNGAEVCKEIISESTGNEYTSSSENGSQPGNVNGEESDDTIDNDVVSESGRKRNENGSIAKNGNVDLIKAMRNLAVIPRQRMTTRVT